MKTTSQIMHVITLWRDKRSSYLLILLVFFLLPCVCGGQTIYDYLRIAAENNPTLKARYTEFEIALQNVAISNALPDPSISLGYFISPIETRTGPQQANIGLVQMFPWFGMLKANTRRDTLLASARYQAFIDARNQLFYTVKTHWYPLYELERKIALQRENINIVEDLKTISMVKYKSGVLSLVDVVRIDIVLSDAINAIEILELQTTPLKIQFNRLLNRPDQTEIIRPTDLFIPDMPKDLNYGFPNDSIGDISLIDIGDHPMIESFDLKIKSAQVQQVIAHKMGRPTFGVGLNYIVVGKSMDGGSGKDAILPTLTMTLPIYRKKYKSGVRVAQLTETALIASKQAYVNTLMGDIVQTRYLALSARKMQTLYDSQIERVQSALQILITSYSDSGEDFEEVLRMQQKLLSYEELQIETVIAYLNAVAKLDYLIGK